MLRGAKVTVEDAKEVTPWLDRDGYWSRRGSFGERQSRRQWPLPVLPHLCQIASPPMVTELKPTW